MDNYPGDEGLDVTVGNDPDYSHSNEMTTVDDTTP